MKIHDTIINDIKVAIAMTYKVTNLLPKQLFVGQLQWHCLLKEAADKGVITTNEAAYRDETKRLEYNGIKIYQVDSKDFISFGYTEQS